MTRRPLPPTAAAAIAGLLATLAQTAAMEAVRLALPGPAGRFPPRQVTEAVLARVNPRRRRPALPEWAWWAATAASHFVFGAAAAAVVPVVPERWVHRRFGGVAYGLAVYLVSYGIVLPALGIRLPQGDRPVRKNLQLLAAHLVWGTVAVRLFHRLAEDTTPRVRLGRSHPSSDAISRRPM